MEGQPMTLAQQLGYGPDEKLLILNADDFGMCHTVTLATGELFKNGGISSATIMVPPEGFQEGADSAVANPNWDVGIHLTLTSEWKTYRWTSVSPSAEVPSLHDPAGFLWADTEDVLAHASGEEAERETRAQIEKALAAGIDVTHIDSHMGAHYFRPDLIGMTMKLSKEYGLPFRLPYAVDRTDIGGQQIAKWRDEGWAILDYLIHEVTKHDDLDSAQVFYENYLRALKPGVTELFIHAGAPTDELRSITNSWARRTSDSGVFGSPKTKALIDSLGIKLISFRELREYQRRQHGWQSPAM